MSTPKPSVLPVSFSIRHVEDERQSRIEGRKITVAENWIKIRLGGDMLHHKITPQEIETYAAEYTAWLAGKPPPGTPLSALVEAAPDMMTEELAQELTALHGVTTLEQLLALPDGAPRLMGQRSLQKRAKELLEQRAADAAVAVTARRESESDALRARVAALEAELARSRSTTQAGE